MGLFFKKKEKVIEPRFKRVFLIVLDSAGIGEAHDSAAWNDIGVNTIKHTLECTTHQFKNLAKFGLFNLLNETTVNTMGYYCIAKPKSNGKDTLTGHLEMMGVYTDVPFKTFTDTGFPPKLIKEIEMKTGRKVIGNCNASGTEIIKELGEESIKTGSLIVYTSADSVLQVAAHESVIPVPELYNICEMIRKTTLKDDWKVGRVIARPFTGQYPNFVRTANRHDYALNPKEPTVLDKLKDAKYDVISVGKIADIFNNCGITESNKTADNTDGIRKIMEMVRKDFKGLCFINLNDFDSKYGHRRDAVGYADALREFDEAIPHMLSRLRDDDLLIITADHGNDPTFRGTDHTRENVPVFIFSPQFKTPGKLGDFETFANIGATIAENFNVAKPSIGESILRNLK